MRKWTAGGMESMIMLFHMALEIVLTSQDTLEKIFYADSFLSQGVSRQSRINVRHDWAFLWHWWVMGRGVTKVNPPNPRRDCWTCHRWSSVWGRRLHPSLRSHGQPPLPLLHLHLLRPPGHPWAAHLGGQRVSQKSRWVFSYFAGVQWSRASETLCQNLESWLPSSKLGLLLAVSVSFKPPWNPISAPSNLLWAHSRLQLVTNLSIRGRFTKRGGSNFHNTRLLKRHVIVKHFPLVHPSIKYFSRSMTLPWFGVQYKTIMAPVQTFGHMFAGDF